MSEAVKIAIISSAAAILGSIGLPKLYEQISTTYVSWLSRKNGNINDLRRTITEQRKEIDLLETRLNDITLRMNILLPLLKKQLKDDPEAIALLEHFEIKTQELTPSQT